MARRRRETRPAAEIAKVRWMIRDDFSDVQEIEALAQPFYLWTAEDFRNVLNRSNAVGMVVELCDTVAGYFVYELFGQRFEILNIAVAPCCWRRGLGRLMIDNLKSRFREGAREEIQAYVNERNLPAQLFFRAMGFRAEHIVPAGTLFEGDDQAISFRLGMRQ